MTAAEAIAFVPLRLLGLAYGAAIRLRNRVYDQPGAVRRAPLPVISVGNLTVGGTGKTPLVVWIARHVLSLSRRPAIVSRGYGGSAGKGPLLVSNGEGPTCNSGVCGDEPLLLARTLAGVVVIVGSDRHAGARAAAEAGADVVILDDGFQHRRLARDLDIVLLDASNPFGNYRLLPGGRLREPVSALRRADVVVITRSRPGDRFGVIERVVRTHNPGAPILHSGHRRLGFFDAADRPVPRPDRALAFCGIGNPSRFRLDLEEEGIEIVGFETRRDHHRYSTAELDRLGRSAASAGATLVTTQKDRIRIGDFSPSGPPLLTLAIEADVYDPQALRDSISRLFTRETAL